MEPEPGTSATHPVEPEPGCRNPERTTSAGWRPSVRGHPVRISSMVLLVAYAFYYRNVLFSITLLEYIITRTARHGFSNTPEHSNHSCLPSSSPIGDSDAVAWLRAARCTTTGRHRASQAAIACTASLHRTPPFQAANTKALLVLSGRGAAVALVAARRGCPHGALTSASLGVSAMRALLERMCELGVRGAPWSMLCVWWGVYESVLSCVRFCHRCGMRKSARASRGSLRGVKSDRTRWPLTVPTATRHAIRFLIPGRALCGCVGRARASRRKNRNTVHATQPTATRHTHGHRAQSRDESRGSPDLAGAAATIPTPSYSRVATTDDHRVVSSAS